MYKNEWVDVAGMLYFGLRALKYFIKACALLLWQVVVLIMTPWYGK